MIFLVKIGTTQCYVVQKSCCMQLSCNVSNYLWGFPLKPIFSSGKLIHHLYLHCVIIVLLVRITHVVCSTIYSSKGNYAVLTTTFSKGQLCLYIPTGESCRASLRWHSRHFFGSVVVSIRSPECRYVIMGWHTYGSKANFGQKNCPDSIMDLQILLSLGKIVHLDETYVAQNSFNILKFVVKVRDHRSNLLEIMRVWTKLTINRYISENHLVQMETLIRRCFVRNNHNKRSNIRLSELLLHH